MNPGAPVDLAEDDARAEWRHALGAPLRDRKVLTGLFPLAAFAGVGALLAEAGARRPLVLAFGRGAGPVPGPEEAEVVMLEAGDYASMTEELRDVDRRAHDLPPEAVAAIEAYDPHHEAVWLLGAFSADTPLHSRPVLGGRPAAWLALEDKLLAEDVWRAVGAPHAPTRVVPVRTDALDDASLALDQGSGVVWSGDARDGFHGGGDLTRWIGCVGDLVEATAFFAAHCDRVRVMPFLEGVPCSIHGMVLPEGTAAFRPVELAILRSPDRRFVYGGQGSTWDPPDEDRAAMRDLAHRVGEHLRARVGYRGAFGIDGVLTRDGFLPTELNTRFAGGLSALTQEVDSSAFLLLQLACLGDRDVGVTAEQLETWALPAMDAHRVAKPVAVSARRLTPDSLELPVTWDGRRLDHVELTSIDPRTGTPDESPQANADGQGASGLATVLVGPTGMGSFARVHGDLLATGERLAPLNRALVTFLDERFDAAFGPVEEAPDVRPRER